MAEDKKIDIHITVPTSGYRKIMRFNRFAVERDGNSSILYFGFVDSRDVLTDVYACAISQEDLDKHKDRLVGFLQKIGGPPKRSLPKWTPPPERRSVEITRFIFMSHTGNEVEVILCSFAIGSIFAKAKEHPARQEITPDPVALLSCDLETLKQLLKELYL